MLPVKFFQLLTPHIMWSIPLTFNVAECVSDPEGLIALHVYSPECLYPTLDMIRIEVLLPIAVVVIAGSDETTSPWSDHVILRGSSPRIIEQVIWAKLPSSTVSDAKLKGPIWGGSNKKIKQRIMSIWTKNLFTIQCLSLKPLYSVQPFNYTINF